MAETFFSSLSETYFILGEISESGIWELNISNGCSVWSKTISRKELEQRAAAADVPANNFIKDLKQSFSGLAANAKFLFYIAECGHDLDVTWKKTIQADLKTILGTFKFKISGNKPENVRLLLSKLSHLTTHLNSSLLTANKQVEALEKTSDTVVKKYASVVEEMREKEDRLLEKFVAVLNEKKKRIRELEGGEGVSCAKKRAVATKPTTSKNAVKSKKVLQIQSESEDDASSVDLFDAITLPMAKSANNQTAAAVNHDEEDSSDDDLFPKQSPMKTTVRPRQVEARVRSPKKQPVGPKKLSTELPDDASDLYNQM